MGAVLVDPRGVIVASAGNRTREDRDPTAHAEILVIREACALAKSERLPEHALYVTLEPCRQRSTEEASCSQRLIEAGISRVVIATRDPHPLGSGGMDRLREAGIQVDLGVLRDDADRFYADFFASVTS